VDLAFNVCRLTTHRGSYRLCLVARWAAPTATMATYWRSAKPANRPRLRPMELHPYKPSRRADIKRPYRRHTRIQRTLRIYLLTFWPAFDTIHNQVMKRPSYRICCEAGLPLYSMAGSTSAYVFVGSASRKEAINTKGDYAGQMITDSTGFAGPFSRTYARTR